jgi:hypothetical protein
MMACRCCPDVIFANDRGQLSAENVLKMLLIHCGKAFILTKKNQMLTASIMNLVRLMKTGP